MNNFTFAIENIINMLDETYLPWSAFFVIGEMAFEDQPKRFFQGQTNVFSSDTTELPDKKVG